MAVNGEHRFGVSALSKTNKDQAYNEELLADKLTGELLFKTTNGDIVSFGYTHRLKDSLNNLKNIGNFLNIYGNIYNIEFDNYNLPCVIAASTNYLNSACNLNLSNNARKFKRFLLHCDIETFSYVANQITRNEYFSIFNIGLMLTFNDTTTKSISIPCNSLTINENIINLSDYLTSTELTKDIINISFTNFTLTGEYKNASGTTVSIEYLRTVLYSLYILLENY